MDKEPNSRLQRRVAGYHDIRMDGIHDLVLRARGASVIDIGCNRGLVGFEFANNGATLVHGCDIFPEGIKTARELFADLRNVESKFEVFDLTRGPEKFIKFFGNQKYDIVLLLAIVHKLSRLMEPGDLSRLIQHIGERTNKYLGWRATAIDPKGNEQEERRLNADLTKVGLKKIHYSEISDIGPAGIWARI